MMIKKILGILIFGITLASCASEKYNSSPITSGLANDSSVPVNDIRKFYDNTVNGNVNASEISNLISSFPKLKNESLNFEVKNLKNSLQNYLYAIEAYNIQGKDRELKNFERSYRKIQHFRKNLSKDDDDVINRYLVRLKTNVAQLESTFADSIAVAKEK